MIALVQNVQASPPPASQQAEVRAQEADDSWRFTIEPFIWIVGLDGKGSADSSPPTNVEIPPIDAFGQLDAGFLLAGEARAPGGSWGLLADGLYVRLADDEGSVRTETEVGMVELGGALAVAPTGSLELLGGLRYVDLSYEVELGSTPDATASSQWIDPWIGARGRFQLGDHWAVSLRGDIGGFGVGSQFSWQALAVLGADIGQGWRIDFGYRALAIDREDNDLEYDVLAYGPLFGLAWHG